MTNEQAGTVESSSVSDPAAASQPAAGALESPAATGSGQPPAAAEGAEGESQRPRVQLNPNVDMSQFKAVANVIPDPVPDLPAGIDQEGISIQATIPSGEKVSIPSRTETSIDVDMASEIDAALTGAAAAVTPPAQTAEGGAPALPAAPGPEDLKPGMKLKGRVQSVHSDNIIVDLGPRVSGLLQAKQFEEGKAPGVGAQVDVVVDRYDANEGLVLLNPAKATVTKPAGNWDAVSAGQIVDCIVTKSNKCGLEVNVSNLRGFLPASQVDMGFVQNLDQYIGQKLRVKISEVNPGKRNLVVSRRALLEEERAEARGQAWEKIQVGQTYSGVVKTVKDYGAFVDIGGVDGLLHVGELSWNRINHPKDILSEGQRIDVKVLSIDRDKQKISLGMKQLQLNPWQNIAERFPVGEVVKGKVTKTTEFGAFVELEPGIEGLVHISELEHRRVMRVTDVLSIGAEIDLKVLSVDVDKKRIALSKKALTEAPKTEKKSDLDLAPSAGQPYERKRKGPLRGGGTGSGGLLFGSPGDE